MLKIGEKGIRADWFKFELPSYALQPYEVSVIGESASGKAWKVEFMTETCDGEHDLFYTKWMPKKAAMSKEEYEEMLNNERKRFEDGSKKYEALIAWAKDHGVKGVRVGLRKDTIMAKIAAAGLVYEA